MVLIKQNTTKWYCAICIHYSRSSQQCEINVDVCKSNLFLLPQSILPGNWFVSSPADDILIASLPSPTSTRRDDEMNILFSFAQLGTLLQGTYPEGNGLVVEYLYLLEISKWPKLLNLPPAGHKSLSLFTNPHFHQSWHSVFFFSVFSLSDSTLLLLICMPRKSVNVSLLCLLLNNCVFHLQSQILEGWSGRSSLESCF